jgi:adenylate cyclase
MRAGRLPAAGRSEQRALAFVSVQLRGAEEMVASSPPEETAARLARFHEMAAAAVHRHGGTLDTVRAGAVLAVFGAPNPIPDPCAAAWSAIQDLLGALDRPNADRRPPTAGLGLAVGAAFGDALAGPIESRGHVHYRVLGHAAQAAEVLARQAHESGVKVLMSEEFRQCLGPAAGAPPSR